jgi:hypothetical protein
MRGRAGLLSLLAAAAVSCVGDDSPSISRDDCAELRDHLVALRVAEVVDRDGLALAPGDLEQHRQAFTHALGDGFLETCASERAPEWLSCARAADSLAAARACP